MKILSLGWSMRWASQGQNRQLLLVRKGTLHTYIKSLVTHFIMVIYTQIIDLKNSQVASLKADTKVSSNNMLFKTILTL